MAKESNTSVKIFIGIVSVIVPLLVAVIYMLPKPDVISQETLDIIYKFPKTNAILNGTTFFILIAALIAIKNKKIYMHRSLMTLALLMSTVFLICYVVYHSVVPDTKFGGVGSIRYIYFFILLSHILLSMAIVPLVLISYIRGLAARFDKHRKIARIALPIWLYVTLTGVLVYLLISPYYAFNL